jgi:hypothetical protein
MAASITAFRAHEKIRHVAETATGPRAPPHAGVLAIGYDPAEAALSGKQLPAIADLAPS